MRQGTTPKYNFKFPFNLSVVDDILVTFKQGNRLLSKHLSDGEVVGDTFTMRLTQAETEAFYEGNIKGQIKILNGITVLGSTIFEVKVKPILDGTMFDIEEDAERTPQVLTLSHELSNCEVAIDEYEQDIVVLFSESYELKHTGDVKWEDIQNKPSKFASSSDIVSNDDSDYEYIEGATVAEALAEIDSSLASIEHTAGIALAGIRTHASNEEIHTTAEKKAEWDAKYSKPANGIPTTDLAQAVKDSLAKADSSVQSLAGYATENYVVSNFVEKEAGKGLSSNDFSNAYKNQIGANSLLIEGKVDKEAGKGLSTNDFSSTYKNRVDSNTLQAHTHSNKAVLDEIEGTEEADAVEVDTSVTSGSTHLITSGAVAEALAGIPAQVKFEADALIAKVNARNNGRTIRFIALSDSHNISTARATTANFQNIVAGNTHAGQAVKYIASRIGLDFVAFLGDATYAGEDAQVYNIADIAEEIMQFNEYIGDGYKGENNIRIVGNHDQYKASAGDGRLGNSRAYSLLGRYNAGNKNALAGYGHFDIEGAKVRVIYLNTSDTTSTSAGTTFGMSAEQIAWFQSILADTNSKTDAEEWKAIILSHSPLDFGTTNESVKNLAVAFQSENKARIIVNIHGHFHCFNTGSVDDAFARFCVPNSCFLLNNHYYPAHSTDYAPWIDTTTYDKTVYDGVVEHGCKDTAFSLVTIDLDSYKCYVDNFGAGFDRELSFAPPVDNLLDSMGTLANYRVNSSGAYVTDTTRAPGYYCLGATTSDSLPVVAGDVIRIKGVCKYGEEAGATIIQQSNSYKSYVTGSGIGFEASNTYDSYVYDADNHMYTFTVKQSGNAKYSFAPFDGIENVVITKNQEI